MNVIKIKLLALMYAFCFLTNGLAASSFKDVKAGGCDYFAPAEPILNEVFFHELIVRSNNENETFLKMASYLEQSAPSCHRFQFKYPLKDGNHAQVLQKCYRLKLSKPIGLSL